jgi:hypothetical protein
MLEIQIQEYRNPVRRYIRTGEVIHGIGLFSMKPSTSKHILSVFESIAHSNSANNNKQLVRVVITNFPRLILIDPVNNTLKSQYTWAATSPPTLTAVSRTVVT